MLFLLRGSTSRCLGKVFSKVKSFEFCLPLLLNLNGRSPPICSKVFSSEAGLYVSNENVKKYLDYLMCTYKNGYDKSSNVSDILKIETLPDLLNKKLKILENIQSLNDIVTNDEEMKKLAKEENVLYIQQLQDIDKKILDEILEKMGAEHFEDIIIEIIPGVGGQEAMLFAQELMDMYMGYLNYLGLDCEIVEIKRNELDGLRKVTIAVSSTKAFDKLRYEAGVHRVQRNPSTEKSGRIHTSTAAVSILPAPRNIDITLDDKDLKIETKRASGAGGQHVNTTDSAVRVTHIPTGISISCQSGRSQIKNKTWALMRLKSTLYEQESHKQTSLIVELRKKHQGLKDRNEKIRTYNYLQERVTDHRISNGTIYNLKGFMKGGAGLDKLVDRIHRDMQQRILLEVIQQTVIKLE
ncbi:PREDICTED: peptide chain release factor 1 [Dufourea novaeangliae]|uniref:Peptide chain release factor 1-like, mitochondrial n=1 Tax=Dufourea novaeangliae TaxID=178035 RepID=A0A154P4P1_DUFNO|nr:PREDICTED: peptide chain release factor 1 [Dufourea novaeangliae]KZC06284.1 Peptide chain release factor 1-like, mitochondrial [Dufourea novaeangliae]